MNTLYGKLVLWYDRFNTVGYWKYDEFLIRPAAEYVFKGLSTCWYRFVWYLFSYKHFDWSGGDDENCLDVIERFCCQ
jgi:hypothetical protein